MKPRRLTLKGQLIGDEINAEVVSPFERYKKLSEIEDIEEELGIEAKIFIRLVVEGCYIIVDKWADEPLISHFIFRGMNASGDGFYASYGIDYLTHEFYFKDYGKKWALTEEELKSL